MCAQKRVIVALYGKSCSGKSTTAKKLAELLSCPNHSASRSVRMRSRELGTSPRDLSLAEHRKIDDATRSVVQSAGDSLVVDGSFLDALLGDFRNIYRVELTCGEEERRRRFTQRSGTDGLDRRDQDDGELRRALHGDLVGAADLTFDTTSKTPDQIAEGIIAWLGNKVVEVRG